MKMEKKEVEGINVVKLTGQIRFQLKTNSKIY